MKIHLLPILTRGVKGGTIYICKSPAVRTKGGEHVYLYLLTNHARKSVSIDSSREDIKGRRQTGQQVHAQGETLMRRTRHQHPLLKLAALLTVVDPTAEERDKGGVEGVVGPGTLAALRGKGEGEENLACLKEK